MRISTKWKPVTTATYLERINRAIDHVATHLGKPIRLQELSRAASLSPFHFHRVFQAVVGETPADYVKRLRLDKALGLMAGPRPGSLTLVALACGFASSSDFSRSFKQRFGVAPRAFDIRAWREEHGRELQATVDRTGKTAHVERLPTRRNPEKFSVKIRDLAPRRVAYIRVDRPYEGDAVQRATKRLMEWAERHGVADS